MTHNVMSGYYARPYQSHVDSQSSMDSFLHNDMLSEMDQGIDPDMGHSLSQNMDQVMGQNLDQRIGQNLDQRMGQNLDQRMGQNLDQSMGQSMDRNLDQSMVQGRGETIASSGAEGQTLDQIISQNDREMQWRRSGYHQSSFDSNCHPPQRSHTPSSSILEFDSPKTAEPADFHFDPNASSHPTLPGRMQEMGMHGEASDNPGEIRSHDGLALDTHFAGMHTGFGQMSDYTSGLATNASLSLDPSSHYLAANMDVSMTFDSGTDDHPPMNTQPQIEQQPIFTSPVQQSFSTSLFQSLGHDTPANHSLPMDQSLMDRVSQLRMPESRPSMSGVNRRATSPRSHLSISGPSGDSMNTPSQQQLHHPQHQLHQPLQPSPPRQHQIPSPQSQQQRQRQQQQQQYQPSPQTGLLAQSSMGARSPLDQGDEQSNPPPQIYDSASSTDTGQRNFHRPRGTTTAS
jgi:hypothetical protein